MAFAAVTILMDTLHQHFLLPTPRFSLGNKTKVKSLYRNLSSLQNSLEKDFKVGEYDEAMKGLEAQLRDASVELRFQIEHQLRLFYLGKAMKLRLESAQKLLPILNRAIKDIKIVDLGCILDILPKHFALPVSRMPARIKKRVESFYIQHRFLFYKGESNNEQRRYMLYEAESIITQELRASYLNKYMKQRTKARRRIGQIFMLGIKLTSYIKKELLKVKNKNAYNQSKNSQNNTTASLRGTERDNITVGDSSQHTSKSTIKMMGCDDEFNMIMDKLNQQSLKREIVSFVGMGGIGKTTLARRIYGDASFISRFDCRAWVTISQEYNPRQVFQGLLHSLHAWKDEMNEASNNELAELVYRSLKRQRYFWSRDVWDDLMKCFQDDNNGSRILLTTRLKNVAEYAGSGSNFCHNKSFLSSDESWNLFCYKVSERIIFPTIAREIVEKCKGLPLAITVAAGLLSNSKQNFNEWERIAENVHTLSLDHSNQQCENIIHLSYTFLPHHLKICFLSFGCFPEDYKVDEDRIVDFWVSEGFLKVSMSKRLEDVARESLQDLLDRNLVLIYKEREGIPKVYQMHDVLRELALREAQKENLFYFKEDNAVGLWYKRIQPINSSCISQPWSIQSKFCSYKCLTHTSNTSSFINLDKDDYIRPVVHTHFKFLRALVPSKFLDVHNTSLEIASLVHLRWLKINRSFHFHSLPLFMLWNLQKLEVGAYSSCEPLYICGLPQLRSLSIRDVIRLAPPRSVHHNLESISFLEHRSCTEELFVRIPNLRTLGVTTDRAVYSMKCKSSNWFESLVYLYKLEKLEIHDTRLHWEFRTIHCMGMLNLKNFLPNLKKLKLRGTRLKWKDMDVVGMLSKLEVLILETGAIDDKKWEPKDGGFRRLKFLSIFSYDLECWEATSGHFPVLECLAIGCPVLKEIPSGFADIFTLKSIKLCACSDSVISSAESIREEQQEYGNDAFAVHMMRFYRSWRL